MKPSVVITGLGAVVPHGHSVAEAWPKIAAGESAVDRISLYDPSGHITQIGAEVKPGFEAPERIGPFALDYSALRYTWGAVHEALQQAGLGDDVGNLDPKRAVVATTGVSRATLEAIGPTMMRCYGPVENPWRMDLHDFFVEMPKAPEAPELLPFLLEEAAPMAAWLAGAGQTWNVASACASGSHALADAAALIENGEAEVVVAVGVCTGINPALVTGFAILGALSTRNDDPQAASRPFDKGRDGFVLGEGAACMVLESAEHAAARGAKPLAELAGWGLSCDSYRLTDPQPEGIGMSLAMQRALDHAGLEPTAIDYINAHGTSTAYNDSAETMAVRTTFGAHANNIPVSSSKSMFGHLIQAAGLLEGIVCTKAIEDSWVPPTINYSDPDPACDLDVVPNVGRKADLELVMSNSFGFGGQNATIILRRPELKS